MTAPNATPLPHPAASGVCLVCKRLSAMLTLNGRCSPCRRAEVQASKACAAAAKRAQIKRRSAR